MKRKRTRIAIVGCGFVADYYLKTLLNHQQLFLKGVWDQDEHRLKKFTNFHSVKSYNNFTDLLKDSQVEIVLNLTNPRSHFDVSSQCLRSGKHVYSEKPLALDFNQAKELVQLADDIGLMIVSAPCSLLGEQAQTIWKVLRSGKIGTVRHVSARLHEGLIHKHEYLTWQNPSGTFWPWKDEFEVGCTLEHAGYYLFWLTAFWGAAKSVTSFSTCLIPDKKTDVPLEIRSPDYSHAVIEFHSGIVAELVSSIVAPHDRGLTITGDDGTIEIDDCWNYGGKVYLKKSSTLLNYINNKRLLSRIFHRIPGSLHLLKAKRKSIPLVRPAKFERYKAGQTMDFSRGPAEMADSLALNRRCFLSAEHSLHVNEIALAMQYPEKMGCPRKIETAFDPIEPMPWA